MRKQENIRCNANSADIKVLTLLISEQLLSYLARGNQDKRPEIYKKYYFLLSK